MEHSLSWQKGRRVSVAEVQPKPIGMALVRGDDWYIQTAWGEELYRIADDPRQERDLVRQQRNLDELRTVMDRRRRDRPSTAEQNLDADFREELGHLGYGD